MDYQAFQVSLKDYKCKDGPQAFFLPLTLQAALYNLAYDMAQVLNKHQIPFWMFKGTMLGAARHQGLIPWDDDLNFGMKLEDVKRIQEIPNKDWQKHKLEISKHWVGFKIYRSKGFTVPNKEKYPYKYPFADVFLFEKTAGDKWQFSRDDSVAWTKKTVEYWPKTYIEDQHLFPLKYYTFDFPGETRRLPGPHKPVSWMNRNYKGWQTKGYTNDWNHRDGRSEPQICKYRMDQVKKSEHRFYDGTHCIADSVNARFLREFVDHIYIINLDHRQDRRQHMHAQMTLLGIPNHMYSFVKATDRSWPSQKAALVELGFNPDKLPEHAIDDSPKVITKDDIKKMKCFLKVKGLVHSRIRSRSDDVRKKGLAEMAVSLSHARIWNMVVQQGKRVLILEDDACVADSFPYTELQDLLKYAQKRMKERFHLIMLGYCYPANTKILHMGQYNALETGRYWCLHSYIVDPYISKKMLEHVFPMDDPVDELLQKQYIMKHAVVFKQPLFIQSPQEGVKSDIQLAEVIQLEMDDKDAFKFGQCATCKLR